MKNARIAFFLVMVILGALILAACSGGTAQTSKASVSNSPGVTTGTASADKLYSTYCSGCHGSNRQGTASVAPLLTAQSLANKTEAQLTDTITNGRPNTAMPAWKDRLSAEDIKALVQYLKSTP